MRSDSETNVIRAMLKWGGSFVEALGKAAMMADRNNLDRIKLAWPEYWEQYAEMAKSLEDEEPDG